MAPFSHAVAVDGWLLVTGQMPTDPDDDSAPLPAGIEAQIQTATLPDGKVWHRVRVGPFPNKDELGKSRAALKESNLEANLIKVREPTQ